MSHIKQANLIKKLELTKQEKELIYGSLLGDGTCSRSGMEYRLRVEHKNDHRDYVLWKYRLLERLCLTPPQYIQAHMSCRFGTVGHPEISLIRSRFYMNGRKVIPKDIPVTPLMFAVLLMDDGSKIHSTVNLALHTYDHDDLEYLMGQLKGYNIRSSVHHDGHEDAKRLYIETASYKTFERLVKPYVEQVPCMTYKLVLTP